MRPGQQPQVASHGRCNKLLDGNSRKCIEICCYMRVKNRKIFVGVDGEVAVQTTYHEVPITFSFDV